MKLTFLFSIVSLCFCFAQNQHKGILLDSETKEPIEFVNIYNGKDYTISNEDGRYAFSTTLDSVIFYRIGYTKLNTTFNQLKDTILLNKSVLELNEVIVTNQKTIWEKFKDSVFSNYKIEPYKEKFFLRCIMKRNDTIVRIQDMVGKLSRKTLFYPEPLEIDKNDFDVELTNMRKVGIDSDSNAIYFIFPSFHETLIEFVRINATGDGFDLKELVFDDKTKTRLNFKTAASEKVWHINGHYVINNSDNAIMSFERSKTSNGAPFAKNKWLRYRTLENNTKLFFEKNTLNDQYALKSAKNNFVVEAMHKDKSLRTIFTLEILLNTFDNFGEFDVKSNVNEHKDIFKLKHPYNAEYWNSQNQLLLTEEMQEFVGRMGANNKEFKVKSNMD